MSIRNLRIGLRASLSFAVLASLLVIVGLFCLGQMATLRESAKVIEASWMPSIENIHDSAANIATIRLEALRLLVNDQPLSREKSKRMIADERQELAQRLERHKALLTNEQEAVMLERLKNTIDQYTRLLQQIIEQIDAGLKEQAYTRLNVELAPLGNQLDTALEELIQFNQRGADSAAEDAATLYERSQWIVGLIIAIALASTLLLAWLLTRSITHHWPRPWRWPGPSPPATSARTSTVRAGMNRRNC